MISIAERFRDQGQVFREVQRAVSLDIRVAVPGIIVSFDATKQTAQVQIALREDVMINDVLQHKEIPILLDVPIVVPRAGNFVLTMPVTAGDECLVIFSDMCIDYWYQNGGVQNQLERRRHDLSDAFAIMGPWSQPNKLSNYSTTAAELRSEDGTTKVSVQGSQVTVSAPTVNVTASSQVNISGNGHTSIEGKDWLTHKHTGVSTGGGVSGPVQ